MNKVILMGRLTRDPEVRYTQGDNSLCIANFTVAVDRRMGRNNQDGGPTADFIPCVVFGKQAEHVEKYYRKGLKTCLSGRIQTRNYTNREGVKVYVTEVVVEDLEFAESKSASQAGSGNYGGGYSGNNSNYGGGNSGNYGGGNYGVNNSNYSGGNYGGNSGSYGASDSGYSAPSQGQNQNTAPASDALDGFMNIPDGIDEELPFS